MKHFIIASILLLSLICNETYSQKKQTTIDSSELQRITNVINVSGGYLYKSGQQQLNGWTLLGVGTAISISNVFVVKEPIFGYIGIGATVSSIPFFIASAFNKRKSGEKLRAFHFDTPVNESIIQPEKQDTIIEIKKPVSEPKYKIGQTVYFYKNDEVIESKIIFIDSIGLKIEYTDVNNNKTKTKFIAFDKVLLEKP
jgi:hypothetical protein